MRFGILPDCHLGIARFRKMLHLQNAYSLINNMVFDQAMNIFKDPANRVDAAISPGDLFDSPDPSVMSNKIAKRAFNGLGRPSFIIGGNHDYSQRDAAVECHPFDLLDGNYGGEGHIELVYREAKVFDLEDCELTMIPYKCLNPDTFKSVYRGKLRSKKKTSILVIHGYVDLDGKSEAPEYALPKEVAANYHLVVCGHVHMPYFSKTKSTCILTPGSLMPSTKATSQTQRPSVYIYDTETRKLETIELTLSPKVIEIATDDINASLESIANRGYSNDLYFVRYNGKMQDVDEGLYRMAVQSCLNLALQTNEIPDFNNVTLKKVPDFWTFVKENHAEWYEEFKNVLKGE